MKKNDKWWREISEFVGGAWMYGGFLRILIMLLLYFMGHVEAKRCKLMQQV